MIEISDNVKVRVRIRCPIELICHSYFYVNRRFSIDIDIFMSIEGPQKDKSNVCAFECIHTPAHYTMAYSFTLLTDIRASIAYSVDTTALCQHYKFYFKTTIKTL